MSTVVRAICWTIIALGIVAMIGGMLTGCESPMSTTFEGQGLSFEEAADRELAEYWSVPGRREMWWGSVGQQICFYWDNNGKQAYDCVSVSKSGWYIAPWQAGPNKLVASTGWIEVRSLSDLKPGMYITPNVPLNLKAPTQCSGWFVYCRVVGWDWSCGLPTGCPKYECAGTCEWPFAAPE